MTSWAPGFLPFSCSWCPATCQLHGTAYHFPAETWLSQFLTFSITSCSGQCMLTPMQSASQAEQAIHPWLVGLILVLPLLVKCPPELQTLFIYSKLFAPWFPKLTLICSYSVGTSLWSFSLWSLSCLHQGHLEKIFVSWSVKCSERNQFVAVTTDQIYQLNTCFQWTVCNIQRLFLETSVPRN